MPLIIGGNSLNASPILETMNERQRFLMQMQQQAQHAQDADQAQQDAANRVKLGQQNRSQDQDLTRSRFLAQQNQQQQFHSDEQAHQQAQMDQQAAEERANREQRDQALQEQIAARYDQQDQNLDARRQFLEQQTATKQEAQQQKSTEHLVTSATKPYLDKAHILESHPLYAGNPHAAEAAAGLRAHAAAIEENFRSPEFQSGSEGTPDNSPGGPIPANQGVDMADEAGEMQPYQQIAFPEPGPTPPKPPAPPTFDDVTTEVARDAAQAKKEHHDQIESDKAAVRQTSQDLHTSTSAERKEKSHAALIDAAGKEPWPVWQKRATEAGMKPDDMTVHPFMQHLHNIDVDLSAIPPEQHTAYFENLAAKLEGKAPKDKTNSFYLADLADAKARVPSGSINENEHGVWKKDAIEYRKEIGKDLPSLREAIQQHIKQGAPSGKPQGAPPSTPEPVPAAAPATPAALPKASTPEEVAKLPPGTHYIWKNGKEYVTK